jgi:transglutaminase-like putative cysteine protease
VSARSPVTLPWHAFLATCAALVVALLVVFAFLPWWLRVLLPALIGLRVLARRRGGGRTSVLIRLGLMVAIVVAVVAEFGNIFGRDAGSALLAAMLTLKLLETDTRRDARVLVAGACFLVMGGFLFDQGFVQTFAAFPFAIVALATLHELVPGPPAREETERSWAPFSRDGLRWGAKLACFAVPFALACFYFFPRFPAQLWGTPQDGMRSRTGMSERMEPGSFSEVSLDDTPQFRVTFDGELPAPELRYWRVFVFWRFDGSVWGGRQLLDGFPTVGPSLQGAADAFGYEVVLDPTDERWLPVLDAPADVPGGARITADFQVVAPRRVTGVERYRATSFTAYRMQTDLPDLLRFAATDMPFSVNPRARALGERLRAETGGNPIAIADRLLGLFNREFSYSLDVPLPGDHPVDEFLFENKVGFCEHYASAFTTVMRGAGVPARVVVGYQGGFWNAIGNYLLIRRSDAHAWAEIWLPGSGWVRYDPTAAVAPERIQRGAQSVLGGEGLYEVGLLSDLRQRWDVLGHWWTRAVIEFNALRQRDLVDRSGLQRLGAFALVVLLVGVGGAALVLAGALGFRRRRAQRDAVLFAWRALCHGLQRSGLERRVNEGPVDFAARAAVAFPDHAAAIRSVSGDFVALRYAGRESDAAAVERFSLAARRLRTALRRQRVRRSDASERPRSSSSRKAQ